MNVYMNSRIREYIAKKKNVHQKFDSSLPVINIRKTCKLLGASVYIEWFMNSCMFGTNQLDTLLMS